MTRNNRGSNRGSNRGRSPNIRSYSQVLTEGENSRSSDFSMPTSNTPSVISSSSTTNQQQPPTEYTLRCIEEGSRNSFTVTIPSTKENGKPADVELLKAKIKPEINIPSNIKSRDLIIIGVDKLEDEDVVVNEKNFKLEEETELFPNSKPIATYFNNSSPEGTINIIVKLPQQGMSYISHLMIINDSINAFQLFKKPYTLSLKPFPTPIIKLAANTTAAHQ